MPENQEPTPAVPDLKARLHDVASMLRRPGSLDPASQGALAELVDELSKVLERSRVPTAEITTLAESTAHLAESLHQKHDLGIVGKSRERLELAMTNAETHAPLLVGVARRLLDALANIGI